MKLKTYILFFSILLVSGRMSALAQESFSSFERAGLHPLIYNKPAVDFFEGALLGNGAMGVVVTTRPDAVVLYFGHNNVWDIRIAENNKEKLGTFKDVFNRVKAIPDTLKVLAQDKWYNDYSDNGSRKLLEALSTAISLRISAAGLRPPEC